FHPLSLVAGEPLPFNLPLASKGVAAHCGQCTKLMKISRFSHLAPAVSSLAAVTALLSACASNTSVPSIGGGMQRTDQTFKFTGKEQTFSVPAHVTKTMAI